MIFELVAALVQVVASMRSTGSAGGEGSQFGAGCIGTLNRRSAAAATRGILDYRVSAPSLMAREGREIWSARRAGGGRVRRLLRGGSVLDELGFTVNLKVLSPASYFELIGNSRRANLDAGVGGWVANYPDPSDFFDESSSAR